MWLTFFVVFSFSTFILFHMDWYPRGDKKKKIKIESVLMSQSLDRGREPESVNKKKISEPELVKKIFGAGAVKPV